MKKNKIKRITYILRPLTSLARTASRGTAGQRVILTYHGITNSSMFNCITRDLLREQIAWLRDHYAVVPLHTLVSRLGDKETRNVDLASITFDDGYVNFLENALPVLEEYNVHGTVFVPSGKIGSYNEWDEGAGQFNKMPVMSYRQLRDLPSDMAEVGSHGLSHRSLEQIPAGEIAEEIVRSKVELEQGLGRPVRFFAFPYGGYPPVLFDERRRKALLGTYSAACTSRWGRFNSEKDIYALRRIGIWQGDSFKDFIDKLAGCYDWLVAKETIGKYVKRMRTGRNGGSWT